MYFVLPVPAIVLVAGFIGYDLYLASKQRQDGIAHAAHVGGMKTDTRVVILIIYINRFFVITSRLYKPR